MGKGSLRSHRNGGQKSKHRVVRTSVEPKEGRKRNAYQQNKRAAQKAALRVDWI